LRSSTERTLIEVSGGRIAKITVQPLHVIDL
jgi:hypothetical protein